MSWLKGLFNERIREQNTLYRQAIKLYNISSKIVKNRDKYSALRQKINRLATDNAYSLDSLQNTQENNRHRAILAIIVFAIIFDFLISFEAIVAILDTVITEDLFGTITAFLPFVLTIIFSIFLVAAEIGISLLLEVNTSTYQTAQNNQYSRYPQWIRLYVIAPISTLIDLLRISVWKTLKQYGIILILPLMSFIAYLNMTSYSEVSSADVNLFLGKTLVIMVAAIVCHVNIVQRASEIIRSWTYVVDIRPQLFRKEVLLGIIQPSGALQREEKLNQENFDLKEKLNIEAGLFVQNYSNYLIKYRDQLLNEDGLIEPDREYLAVIPEWVIVYIRNLLGRFVLQTSATTISTNLHKGIITGENLPTIEGVPEMPSNNQSEAADVEDEDPTTSSPFF